MANKIQKFTVNSEQNKFRLDIFLAEEMNISRSQAQKLIDQKLIAINGITAQKSGNILKENDIVSYDINLKETEKPKNIISRIKEKIQPPKINLKIISETPDYLIIEKPTGLLTHPTMAGEKNSVSSLLLKKYPELKKVGENELRPGIVHRLDKDASGLLVVARTQKMFKHLKAAFKKRTVEKEYTVLVHGRVAKDEDEINFPIARSETADRMAARPLKNNSDQSESLNEEALLNPGEKEARTEFLVLKRFVNFTLLSVRIHTGRMHQIRVHLLAYNHPVVGDPLYIQKKRKDMWDKKLGRLFLHCSSLSFKDLDDKIVSFESELPQELSEFLKLLK
jgi:23S rRNA pseudouridine1911/1915/1917 synthase